ncbi:hypothetical protein HKCCE4037_11650 [Rhodobacterales bacterium HKCCE4037]|nr:hypothetical protein [Rhodobacterales bacterium HKCCE4037]
MDHQIDAKEVYQATIDILSETAMNGDFDLYAALFHLPHRLHTRQGVVVFETRAELQRAFDATVDSIARHALDGMTRVCVAARLVDSDRIEGTHRTWLTMDEKQIEQAYEGHLTLRLTDGVWRVAASRYDSRPDDLPEEIRRLVARPGTPPDDGDTT